MATATMNPDTIDLSCPDHTCHSVFPAPASDPDSVLDMLASHLHDAHTITGDDQLRHLEQLTR